MPTRSFRAFAVAAVAGLAVVASGSPALAAPGDLDPLWSGDGKLIANLSTTADPAFAVAVQDDGNVIVAGAAGGGNGGRVFVARYLPDGAPDPAFSGDGKVFTD